MAKIAHHFILVVGDSFASCKAQVENFFSRTELVRYDRITISDDACIAGSDHIFDRLLTDAIGKNKKTLEALIKDLEGTGIKTTADLLRMPQGYPSKVLHIATHFLDGFIGIDSAFYNLVDDSHWLPERTRQDIADQPEKYWLIPVEGFSDTPEKASLIHR